MRITEQRVRSQGHRQATEGCVYIRTEDGTIATSIIRIGHALESTWISALVMEAGPLGAMRAATRTVCEDRLEDSPQFTFLPP